MPALRWSSGDVLVGGRGEKYLPSSLLLHLTHCSLQVPVMGFWKVPFPRKETELPRPLCLDILEMLGPVAG